MNEFYYDEITDESYEELINFSKWLNKHYGNYPIIVGGWAVWAYTKGLGSRDIDIVFPNPKTMHSILLTYFKYNGYEKTTTLFTESYSKKFDFNGKQDEIIIDACTAQDTSTSELPNVRIPWKWVQTTNQLFELEKNVFIYIPTIELLLTQKIKAAIDRANLIQTEPQHKKFDYYKAKVWKDYNDILSLLKKEINKKELEKLFQKSGLTTHVPKFIERIKAEKKLIQELKTTTTQIDKLSFP